MRTSLIVAVALSNLLALPVVAHQEVSARRSPLLLVIPDNLRVAVPIHSCTVPTMVLALAKAVGAPAGVEYPPGPCDLQRRRDADPGDDILLIGLTIQEALDHLAQLDSGYRVIESDGMLIARPQSAWSDRENVLHRSVSSFGFTDEHMGGALGVVREILGAPPSRGLAEFAMNTPEANRRFSLGHGATSVIGALNAIARAHGTLYWVIKYCRPQARPEFASVSLFTFDGGGI